MPEKHEVYVLYYNASPMTITGHFATAVVKNGKVDFFYSLSAKTPDETFTKSSERDKWFKHFNTYVTGSYEQNQITMGWSVIHPEMDKGLRDDQIWKKIQAELVGKTDDEAEAMLHAYFKAGAKPFVIKLKNIDCDIYIAELKKTKSYGIISPSVGFLTRTEYVHNCTSVVMNAIDKAAKKNWVSPIALNTLSLLGMVASCAFFSRYSQANQNEKPLRSNQIIVTILGGYFGARALISLYHAYHYFKDVHALTDKLKSKRNKSYLRVVNHYGLQFFRIGFCVSLGVMGSVVNTNTYPNIFAFPLNGYNNLRSRHDAEEVEVPVFLEKADVSVIKALVNNKRESGVGVKLATF